MKVRLCGSYYINRDNDRFCQGQHLGVLLSQLPSHCMVQVTYPFDDSSMVVLIYSYDDDFDLTYWLDNILEL